MEVTRYDAVPLRAVIDATTGYLRDSPVVGRSGVQEYRQANGRVMREYRPPDVVFAADALARLHGIPIIDEHQSMVTAANVRQHAIGTVLSHGRQDGQVMVADVVIYDTSPITKAKRKELSLAYSVRLDETPGVTPEGEAYDTRVIEITRYDHLAIVAKGRAGVARLRLDGADAASTDIITTEENPMPDQPVVTVRLDGLNYSAAPEVANALTNAQTRADAAEGERDAQRARADAAETVVVQVKADADARVAAAALEAANATRQRLTLEAAAKAHEVPVVATATDRDVKVAVITKLTPGAAADLATRADAYIDARYDMALADADSRKQAGAAQVQTVTPTVSTTTATPIRSAQAGRDLMIRAKRA